MRRLLLLTLLALGVAACYTGERVDQNGPLMGGIRYVHDERHSVSCWTAYDSTISCLPDSQVENPG